MNLRNHRLTCLLALALAMSCAKKGPAPATSAAGEGEGEGEGEPKKPAEAKKEGNQPAQQPAQKPAEKKGQLELAKDLPPIPAEEAWRSTSPINKDLHAPKLPSFKTAKLKNGITVIVPAEKSLLPIISLQLVTRGGAALDPPDKAGLSSLVYAMLSEGAGKRDTLAFSDAVADLGADFGAASDRDRGAVFIVGLSRNADAMLGILADAVLRPQMKEKDFARRKEQQIAALIAARGSAEGLAFEAIPPLMYGATHPYGHPPTGTPEVLKNVTLADVKGALPNVLAPERSALIAAGDITLEDAVKLAEKHFGKWKAAPKPMAEIAPVVPAARKQVVIIDKSDSPQTMVLVGRPIFGRGHPDEAALTVLNAVYGGMFTSRLNMNLREDKGYTYGALSQTTYRLGVGSFLAYSAIRQDATAPALMEFFKELDNLLKSPPTPEEVSLAQAGLILALPGQFERASASAKAAASIFVYDLPLDYYTQAVKQIEGVDAPKTKEIAKNHLDPSLMTVVLVGDATVIKGEVEKLKLGEVVVRAKP